MIGITFSILSAIGSLLIVAYYIRQILKFPLRNGEIFRYWVESWLFLFLSQILYIGVQANIIDRFAGTVAIDSILVLLLSYYLLVVVVIHYERELNVNSLCAWRGYRIASLFVESIIFILIFIGLFIAAKSTSLPVVSIVFGATGVLAIDIYFGVLFIILVGVIPFLLLPLKQNGRNYDKPRVFLTLGATVHVIARVIQLIGFITYSLPPIVDITMRLLMTLSVFLVFLGIHHKQDIDYVRIKAEQRGD